MIFAKAFAGTLLAFLAIDMIWIVRVVRPMYSQQLGMKWTPFSGPGA